MGCTGSVEVPKNIYDFLPDIVDGKKRLNIEGQFKKYFEIQDKFNAMLMNPKVGKFIKDSVIDNVTNVDKYIHDFYAKFENEFSSENFSEVDFKMGFMLKVLSNFIEDETEIKFVDFMNIVSNILETHDFNNKDFNREELAKILILTIRRFFPQSQLSIHLRHVPNLIIAHNNLKAMPYIFPNIKFNAKFKAGVYKISVNNEFFKGLYNSVETAETILYNENLNGVCLEIGEKESGSEEHINRRLSVVGSGRDVKNGDNSERNKENIKKKSTVGEMANNIEIGLNYILEGIKRNGNINSLIVSSTENGFLIFSEKIINNIFNLISEKNLFFLCISQIPFSISVLKSFSKFIKKNKKLRFLILDISNVYDNNDNNMNDENKEKEKDKDKDKEKDEEKKEEEKEDKDKDKENNNDKDKKDENKNNGNNKEDNIYNECIKIIIDNILMKSEIVACVISGGNLEINNENVQEKIRDNNNHFKYFAYVKELKLLE